MCRTTLWGCPVGFAANKPKCPFAMRREPKWTFATYSKAKMSQTPALVPKDVAQKSTLVPGALKTPGQIFSTNRPREPKRGFATKNSENLSQMLTLVPKTQCTLANRTGLCQSTRHGDARVPTGRRAGVGATPRWRRWHWRWRALRAPVRGRTRGRWRSPAWAV